MADKLSQTFLTSSPKSERGPSGQQNQPPGEKKAAEPVKKGTASTTSKKAAEPLQGEMGNTTSNANVVTVVAAVAVAVGGSDCDMDSESDCGRDVAAPATAVAMDEEIVTVESETMEVLRFQRFISCSK